ncbi:MAG: VaFE repeat-containing surface-anchored protein [Dorea sp.]|nr:VaFE repeat-containing surface-anchored protein [Dorea sp.]
MKKTKRGISCVLVLAVCLSLILQRAGAVSASEVRTDEYNGEKAKHSVTLEEAQGGVLRFDGMQERTQRFEENAQVLLWATPNEMFALKSIGIFDGQTGEELFSPEQTEEGAYTFPMPDRSVTVRGTFVQITEEKESEATEDGTGTEEGAALGSVQMNAAGAYAAVRSGSTSSQLRAKIGRIRVFSDSSEQIKTYNEGMLGVDGKAAFCLNPLVNFQSGSVTAVNLLEYGLKQSDITACALYIKYVYEHTELTDNQKYLAAQCLVWRHLNGPFSWNCGNIHVDGSDFNLDLQNQVYGDAINKVAANMGKYIGEGTAYLNGASQPLAHFLLREIPEQPDIPDKPEIPEEPPTGYARLVKESANTEITANNSCYSLGGAQYGVYKNRGCTQLAATLITDTKGKSDTVELEAGTYYVKEKHAPKGYILDTQVHTVRVSESKTSVLRVSDEPVHDRLAIELYKIDRGTRLPGAEGAASLENSRFMVNFYQGYYGKENLPVKPTRSWVLKARTGSVRAGAGRSVRLLEETEKVSGDEFYKVGDTITLPLGTISVEEVQPPAGYLRNPLYLQAESGAERGEGVYVSQIIQDGIQAALEGGNAYAVADGVFRGDIELTKIDKNTQTPMEGVQFRLTSNTTGESHVFSTDANGHYSTNTAYAAHSHNTNGGNIGDGIWFGKNADGQTAAVDDSVGALPYDTYTLEELKCAANEGKYLYKSTVSITRDSYIVNLGNIENADVRIGTSAKNEATGTRYANADSDTAVVDTVDYIGLKKGEKFRMVGTLMNRTTGEQLTDKSGNVITVTKEFTPKDSNGTVEMEFFFDASGLRGMDIVVFEELYKGDEKLAEHKDINDSSQTIHFPDIATQAADQETGMEMSKADEEVVIEDTVAYENLQAGRKYIITGILMDKETGKEAKDRYGNKIEAQTEFTAAASNGTAEVVFRFDGREMGGRTLVAFETLKKDGREYAVHADIKDEAQTIYIPKLGTVIRDDDTKQNLSRADTDVTLIDEVKYTNLVPGRGYVLEGMLIDQETKKAAEDAQGNKITARTSFTPEKKDGSVEAVFKFDGSKLKGKTLTAYEELFCGGRSVAEHKDADDKAQTVYFPEIATEAEDEETKLQMSYAGEEVTIRDRVRYKNLIPGKKYTMRGTLKDKVSGQPLKDAEGKEIASETEFTAKDTDGEAEVVFRFDGSLLAGKVTVAFEELLIEKKSIAVHADLNDKPQTVRFPRIQTTALDQETGVNLTMAAEEITVVDKVAYQHLTADHQYSLEGTLMDQETGKPALDADGKEIHARAVFVPKESDGTAELTFRFPGKGLEGHTFVVFEELFLKKSWFKKVLTAVHKDIEDEAQTIHIPKIHTMAIDDETETHQAKADETVSLTDRVSYANVLAGYEYKLTGVLMDQETGEPLRDDDRRTVTAETVFTAEEAEGEAEVKFEFGGVSLAGKTVVVFETLTFKEKPIAKHEDLEDEKQSVYIPSIRTAAAGKGDGRKEIVLTEEITIVDQIEYKNLLAGEEYKAVGTVMDKETGEALIRDGKPVTAESIFTAKEPSGKTEVEFTFKNEEIGERELVIFERLYMTGNGKEAAVHEDLNDEGQTVKLVKKQPPAKTPKTGDISMGRLCFYLAVLLISGWFATHVTRRRMPGKKQKFTSGCTGHKAKHQVQ